MKLTSISTVFCASLLGLATTGCNSLGMGDDNGRETSRETLPTNRTSVSDLPDGARKVAAGAGEVSFTAKDDGRVYVVDTETNRVISERAVEDGQEILVRPEADQVLIGGNVVFNGDLKRENRHAIYFASKGDVKDARNDNRDTLPAKMENADRVASGAGELTYTAKEDGRVFVWDRTTREIVYESAVDDGDRILVSPEQNLITLSSRDARIMDRLDRDHAYEVYFDED